MSREDLHKLLGGYATGNLTPQEREALFTAALDDQELFDALAREQSLRDLLRDPAAKAHLLAALDPRPAPWWSRWWRPAAVGFGMAAVIVAAVVAVKNIAPAPKVPIMAVAKPQQTAETAPVAPLPADAPPAVPEEPRAKKTTPKAVPERIAVPEREKLATVDSSAKTKSQEEAPAVLAAPPPPPPPPPPKAEPAPQAAVVDAVGDAPPITISPAPAPKTELTEAKYRAFDQALSARSIFLNQVQMVNAFKGNNFADQSAQQSQQQARSRQAPSAQQQRAVGQQAAAAAAKAKASVSAVPEQSGVRYSILTTSGRPQLRIETNSDGYLYAMARGDSGSWRPVYSGATAPLQPRIIGGLQPDEKEIYVVFSRDVRETKGGPAPPEPGDVPDTNLVESDGDTTYVVNPLAGDAGRLVRFTIRLL